MKSLQESEAARCKKIVRETLVRLGTTGMLERPRLPPDKERAKHYLEQAERFRLFAEAEPVVDIKAQLRAVAEQYQQLADRLLAN
jgi:hypothetical protein